MQQGDTVEQIWSLIEALYPICRSITGHGVRATLKILQQYIPLQLHEVASGTPVLDWTIPDEWNIRDAWIKDKSGRKVVDFRESNLHVVSYSEPIRRWLSNEELQLHLYSVPAYPEWIPYRTSYYTRTWGFCLTENQRQELTDDKYEVCIDSELASGSLTYGELLLPGEQPEEYLFSTHLCHPSLCNDNLSGVAVSVFLARHLSQQENRRRSYRFLFIPGTIGAITWLARNPEAVRRIRGGFTLVCLGDHEPLTYKRTFQGNVEIDRVVEVVLRDIGQPYHTVDFTPYGYDERQYCSPGFRLPIGSLMRGRYGEFPQYHTSADNLDFVSPDQLESSLESLRRIVYVLERNRTMVNQFPFGEPHLGKRGVYAEMDRSDRNWQLALLWILSMSDGSQDLLSIAERSGIDFESVVEVAALLEAAGLVKSIQNEPS